MTKMCPESFWVFTVYVYIYRDLKESQEYVYEVGQEGYTHIINEAWKWG